jgi:hypothetical protein
MSYGWEHEASECRQSEEVKLAAQKKIESDVCVVLKVVVWSGKYRVLPNQA